MSAARQPLEPGPAASEPTGPTGAEEQGTGAAASSLISSTLDLARHIVELAAAELRLAALSGVTMVMLVIVTAALIVMAWGFVAAVAAYLLVAAGLPWPAAGLLVAAAHAVAAYLLWRAVVRLSRSLTLPELRRSVLSTED